jgi:DNA-binding transcriptional ArsR family regulator
MRKNIWQDKAMPRRRILRPGHFYCCGMECHIRQSVRLTFSGIPATIQLTFKLNVLRWKFGEKREGMGLQNTLRALADPTRRSILELLKSGRLSAGEISERFDMTAAAVSRHLSVLKEADLIRDTRQGKFIIYELNASVLEEILLWLTALKGEENHAEE